MIYFCSFCFRSLVIKTADKMKLAIENIKILVKRLLLSDLPVIGIPLRCGSFSTFNCCEGRRLFTPKERNAPWLL